MNTDRKFARDSFNGVTVSTVVLPGFAGYETIAVSVETGDELGAPVMTSTPEQAQRAHGEMCKKHHTTSFERVTLYTRGMLGMIRVECRTLSIRKRSYAQHPEAIELRWVAKGQRRERGTILAPVCGKPDFFVVLSGWDHLKPASAFGPAEDRGNGVSVSQSRYSACDPRWESDFTSELNGYVSTTGASLVASSPLS
ncbi:MAG: hypothetical protein HOW73_43595 [Polyangiaceae bacterium]|nr:hypothetical protein [Polyangiaceae bacterium]